MNESRQVVLDGNNLTLEGLREIARFGDEAVIAEESKVRMQASRTMLDEWIADEKIIYGITTGFGPLVSTLIPTKYQSDLQINLIRSHSANVGPAFSREETRAAMALRLNAFAKGYSAIRLETVELLRQMLNAGIHPRIPQWGSVGASGDLTPSAHIALALMGEGMVEYKGKIIEAKQAFAEAELTPVVFAAKEGLALINGTTVMTGVGALQLADAWNLVVMAEIISALSIEALHGSLEPFMEAAHAVKPHPGQLQTARNLTKLLAGSGLVWNREQLEEVRAELQRRMKEKSDVLESGVHVQNVYSLRATPQILGAVRDALTYITGRITT